MLFMCAGTCMMFGSKAPYKFFRRQIAQIYFSSSTMHGIEVTLKTDVCNLLMHKFMLGLLSPTS
jgi:hypothetical protein